MKFVEEVFDLFISLDANDEWLDINTICIRQRWMVCK